MTPVELPAGVYNAPTAESSSSSYRETNLMRWAEGKMTPMGGWAQNSYDIIPASRVRRTHTWIDNNGAIYTAFLCESHIYVDIGGVLHDVTPTGGIVSPYAGDVLAGGYGDGDYGEGTYGTARPNRNKPKPITPAYTLNNWGQQLRAMTSADGRLLSWDPATPDTKAVAVTNAPAGYSFTVTPERHIIIFGAEGDFRKFDWSDQEDDTNWAFADVNSKAGFFDVEPASPILANVNMRDGTIFMTASKVYVIHPQNLPYVYGYEEVFDSCTPISAASLAEVAGGAIWVTENGFWQYDGTSVVPLDCPVWTWITDSIDSVYSRYEAVAINNYANSELWWFFPQEGQRYNTSCVVYNYREKWWSMGRLARSAGSSSPYNSNPTMADGTTIYTHESGTYYPGAELPWAETYSLNIEKGSWIYTLNQMLPNIKGRKSDVKFKFFYKKVRTDDDTEMVTPDLAIRPNGYVDVRITGRDIRLRVESAAAGGGEWTMGQTLIDTVRRGKR